MFTGRDDEVRALTLFLASPGLAKVRGVPGIGKTALVQAVIDSVTGPPACYAAGIRALRHRKGMAFARAIRLPVPDDEVGAVAVARVATRGRAVVLDDAGDVDSHSLAIALALASDRSVCLVVTVPTEADPAGAAAAELIDLGPLTPAASAEVARAVNPQLSDAAVRAVVGAARGNPAALLLLASSNETTVRRALAKRLARLSTAGRTAAVALGLLGRPAPGGLLGPGAAELCDSGLALARGQTVAFGSGLIYRVAASLCGLEARADLHRRLAGRLTDPLERAGHLLAAGDVAGVARSAEDVGLPAEVRAQLCERVAENSGDGASRWWFAAAQAWRAVGDGRRADDAERRATSQELSSREREVMLLVVDGLSSAQIARRLGITPGTVEDHVTAVLRKTGARTRTQAAVIAEGSG